MWTLSGSRGSLGSSPLTRGKLRRCGSGEYVMRLIPAHAGKTREPGHKEEPTEAHPRSRGENVPVSAGSAWRFGSSPLTRGKLEVRGACPSRCRLIPAHAGKTMVALLVYVVTPAHPRSRGENESNETMALPLSGSSPLTRGKLRTRGPTHRRRRLIPAHAGKTPAAQGTIRSAEAHPRSRGENSHANERIIFLTGSSPLTRGKLSSNHPTPCRCRLIPAHAGKTRGA